MSPSAAGLTQWRSHVLFRASPVPTFIWQREGDDDLVLVAHNDAADAASGGRAPSYLGQRASGLYAQDEPEILNDLRRCLRERSTFGREMTYTIPGTDETYDLRVTYAYTPPDLVLVHLVSVTEERRARRELERTVTDLRRADRERRHLLRELVSSQERERQRIAEGLHDDTVQQLVALSLRLEMLRSSVPDAAAEVERLEGLARRTIERLRHMAFALHPPSIHTDGLEVAVRSLLEHLESETGIRHTLVCDLDREPSSEVGIHAFRVVQESLTNVRKHARATSVLVELVGTGDALTVQVSDDGTGFDPQDVPADHFGLATMHQRAELLGGRLHVTSRPGAGTTVRAELPLRRRVGRR